MNDDNVVSLGSKLQAKAIADAQQRESVGRSARHFRTLTRAVRLMRDDGASTKEIAHTLRVIANELDGDSKPA